MALDFRSSALPMVVSVYEITVHQRLVLMLMREMLGMGIGRDGTSFKAMAGEPSSSLPSLVMVAYR